MTEENIDTEEMVPVEEASEEVQKQIEEVQEKINNQAQPENPENRIDWTPKTELGKKVLSGEVPSLDVIFQKGYTILEPEIVDFLLPNIEHELILTGGSPGKGGGIRRTPGRRTARMHKSGRRYKTSCLVVCGNKDGYVGVGIGKAVEFRDAIDKALKSAKLNIMPIYRGSGSWEDAEIGQHSIPAKTEGKEGSVKVILRPAPKGTGLVASNEIKKLLQLAGIKDIWVKSFGSTSTRINHIRAVLDALRNLNVMKIPEQTKEKTGAVIGC